MGKTKRVNIPRPRRYIVTWLAPGGIKSRSFHNQHEARNFARNLNTAGCNISTSA